MLKHIKATYSNKVFDVAGLEQSPLTNFNFSNSLVTASNIGTFDFTEGWSFNNFKMSVTKKKNFAKTASKEEEERLK